MAQEPALPAGGFAGMTSRRWMIAAALILAASPAFARHRHHHMGAAAAAGVPYADWSGWQAETIAREAARQQAAPGVTEELSPDARQTATGGPVGGVPGFEGL